MHLMVNAVLWLCLIWSSCWMLKDEDRGDDDWDRILPDLASLCPGQQYCWKTKTTDGHDTHLENACCRGCSCDRNCSESRDCCWGDDNVDVISKIPCLRPSSDQYLQVLDTYNFISGPPTDGCKDRYSQKDHVACSSEADPLDNFYPVYSKSLDKNFKNEACARCHGAGDAEAWSGVLHSDSPFDFIGSLADFNEKKVLINSYIVFSPPNEESSSFNKRCFAIIDTCSPFTLDRFYIPSYVLMDREAIIDACEQGPRALYLERPGRAFKNVFCAICNRYSNKYTDGLKCVKTLDKTLNPPITVLLDGIYMKSNSRKGFRGATDRENRNDECYRPKNSKNESVCTELLCPSLQTRLQTGKCGYVAKFASFEHLVLCLNVSTGDVLDRESRDVMNMSGSQIALLLGENSPWSRKYWVIFAIGARVVEGNGLELLVCLSWKTKALNLETLNKQMKTSLVKRWKIRIGMEKDFGQEISKHGKIMGESAGNANMHVEWEKFPKSPEMVNLTSPIWERLYLTDVVALSIALYVDQTFLCEHIELSPHEYESEGPGSLLYLTTTHVVLYPGQYMHLAVEDGSWRIRVCLKDSGYYRKVVSGTGTRQGKFSVLVLTFSFCVGLVMNII